MWGADLLTATRLVIAAGLWLPVSQGWWATAGVLLSLAWLTDAADGRLARRAGVEGRLGPLDLHVDTAVGGSLLIGMIAAGELQPLRWTIVSVVLAAAFLVAGNEAAALLLQGSAYAMFLVNAWQVRVQAFVIPVTAILAIALVDRHRLTGHILPLFFERLRHPLGGR